MPGQKAGEEERRQQILAAAYEVAVRAGIAGLTVRGVAARAGVSHGLVLFHFKRRAQLVDALLEGVLGATLELHVPPDIARHPGPLERLRLVIRREMERLAGEPGRVRLLLECWALGARDPSMRRKVGAALAGYRAAFVPLAEEVLAAEAGSFVQVTAAGLAAVVVGVVHECALQASVDPDHFAMDEYLAAVQGLFGTLASPA